MTRDQILEVYLARYGVLRNIAKSMSGYIVDIVGDMPHVDRIAVRAKSPDRYTDKALKEEDGNRKYTDPISQIQDQIGARVTVFYLADVQVAKRKILEYFTTIEMVSKEPERNSEFGYFGEHFILKIPDDVIPEELPIGGVPEFFELQIKTLFQHAWSEADHDLAYKSIRDLNKHEQRQIAFSAAQAWGADQIFDELAKKLASGARDG